MQERLAAGRFRSSNWCRAEIHSRESGEALDGRIAGRGLWNVSLSLCGAVQEPGWGNAGGILDRLENPQGHSVIAKRRQKAVRSGKVRRLQFGRRLQQSVQ